MADPKPKKKTPLEALLDDDQRKALAEYLCQKVQSVHNQMRAEWHGKREKFEKQMNDDFSWRSGGGDRSSRLNQGAIDELVSGIFDLQNDSLNIIGGFAAFQTAKTVDDIFGTDPFYVINPEGVEDNDLAQAMQRHSEWKLRSSTFKDAAVDAIDLAYGLGEGVLKSTWRKEIDIFETNRIILVGGDGEPILTADGDYVYEGDTEDALDPVTGAVVGMSIPKDPLLVVNPAGVTWEDYMVEQTNVSYNGVMVNVMHYGDILCPLTEETLEDSPFVGHRFQMLLSEARNVFELDDDMVAKFRSESTEAKADKERPKQDLGESPENIPWSIQPDPVIEFVECWIRHDPVDDGRVRRIMAVVAVNTREIVKMDYQANLTPKGQSPFFCIRGMKVKNRWYGRGYYEAYEKAQEFIDRNLNRIEYRNRFHSNPATFFDPSQLFEDEESGEFRLEPGRTYRTKPGVPIAEIIQTFSFPDLDERTWELMQFMIQVIQVRTGVTSAAQGEVSSLPSTSTATGIESIMQSASTLARLPMNNIKAGLEKTLLYTVKLIYANMDTDETFSYFAGDQQKAGVLAAEKVQDIDMNVRLLMTRFNQREKLESATKAIQIMAQYVLLPEPEKASQRPMFIQAISGLGFNQADSIVREPIQLPPVDPATGQPLQLPAGDPQNVLPIQQTA